MAEPSQEVPESLARFLVECVGNTTWTEVRKRQSFRLAIMLQNKSPKAWRLVAMFDHGEISGDQLLEMMT